MEDRYHQIGITRLAVYYFDIADLLRNAGVDTGKAAICPRFEFQMFWGTWA
jgi:hypothetical protein